MDRWIARPADHQTAEQLVHETAGMPDCQNAGPTDCRTAGLPDRRTGENILTKLEPKAFTKLKTQTKLEK